MVSILVVNPVIEYLLGLLIAPCMHIVLVPDPGMEGRMFAWYQLCSHAACVAIVNDDFLAHNQNNTAS